MNSSLVIDSNKGVNLQLITTSGEKSTKLTLGNRENVRILLFILGDSKKARITVSSATTQQKDTNILQSCRRKVFSVLKVICTKLCL